MIRFKIRHLVILLWVLSNFTFLTTLIYIILDDPSALNLSVLRIQVSKLYYFGFYRSNQGIYLSNLNRKKLQPMCTRTQKTGLEHGTFLDMTSP